MDHGPLIPPNYCPDDWVNSAFALAAVLSLITFSIHTFVGGKYAARPLLAARDFDRASRGLNYMTWHMVTALLAAFTVGFGWAALRPAAMEVAVLLAGLAGILSLISIWAAVRAGFAPWRFPSSWLFLLIAAAGLAGPARYGGACVF